MDAGIDMMAWTAGMDNSMDNSMDMMAWTAGMDDGMDDGMDWWLVSSGWSLLAGLFWLVSPGWSLLAGLFWLVSPGWSLSSPRPVFVVSSMASSWPSWSRRRLIVAWIVSSWAL